MIAVCLLLFAADDARAARALLDRAVAAMGGEKVLAAPHALTGRSKGTVHLGAGQEIKNTFTVQGLDRMKWETEINSGTLLLGLNKAGLWIAANGGKANDVPKEMVPVFRRAFAALRTAETLVPLRAKGWKLSSLGELKVDGTPAVGLKASRAGEPDLDLWFDKKTMLPVQVEIRLPKPGESAETVLSALLSDYREVGGRKHFGKMTVSQDGKKVLEVERTEVKAVDVVDEVTFDKP